MFDSVKEALTNDIEAKDIKRILETEIKVKMLESVKETLIKEIEYKEVKDFFEMEIELKKLRELLLAEIKIKEFLLQDIHFKDFLPDIEINIPTSKKAKSSSKEKNNGLGNIASESSLRCDANLLATLRNDHDELKFCFKEMIRSAKLEKYSLVPVHIETFTTLALKHYKVADEIFYPHLRTHIKDRYPKYEGAINSLSLEMKEISAAIVFSLYQVAKIPINEVVIKCLIKEYIWLGEQLINRIDREERILFHLYEDSLIKK